METFCSVSAHQAGWNEASQLVRRGLPVAATAQGGQSAGHHSLRGCGLRLRCLKVQGAEGLGRPGSSDIRDAAICACPAHARKAFVCGASPGKALVRACCVCRGAGICMQHRVVCSELQQRRVCPNAISVRAACCQMARRCLSASVKWGLGPLLINDAYQCRLPGGCSLEVAELSAAESPGALRCKEGDDMLGIWCLGGECIMC